MAWLFLIVAGVFEMIGVPLIHRYNRQRNWRNLALLIVVFGASLQFLALALKTLPMGIAYAVWTGIGAAGGAVLGMVLHGESRDWRRILFIVMILGAAVGLKLIA